MTLAEHLTKATSANMFYFVIDYENETNIKVAASNVNIKIHQLFFKKRILGVRVTTAPRKTLGGLDTYWLFNNVYTILVIMIVKLILICLSNSFFNFFIKMKNELYFVFHFFMKMKNEWSIKNSKKESIKHENSSLVSYLNFVFFTEVKAKSNYRILNFVFQFIKKTNGTLGTRIVVLLHISQDI